MKVAIIDYGSGNLRSAAKAFERAGRDAGLAADVMVTAEPEAVRDADRIVLPGVGAFGDCAAGLRAIPGMEETLNETVREKARPFLGICVGMQLMAARGLEHGTHQGLGWLEGDVVKIEPADPSLKIPHMGWNELEIVHEHPLLDGISATHAYFVHSYAFAVAEHDALVANVDYAGPVTAMVAKDNMAGTQFHPEKSQELGLALIGNFLTWRP
jgi:imidazole glycerol-phosphate synthase subunit HisH